MLVRDWMTEDPLTVTPDTPVLEAINLSFVCYLIWTLRM